MWTRVLAEFCPEFRSRRLAPRVRRTNSGEILGNLHPVSVVIRNTELATPPPGSGLALRHPRDLRPAADIFG